MDRLRPPSCYVKFDVTSKIARPVRTIGLEARFPLSAAPLRVRRLTHTQYNTIPIQTLCVRSRPVFSYLPVSVFVLG